MTTSPPSPTELRDFVIAEARRLGFHRIGIVPVAAPARYRAYRAWLDAGMHGTMAYMSAPEHIRGRAHLSNICPEARTVVIVALAYAKSNDSYRRGQVETETAIEPESTIQRLGAADGVDRAEYTDAPEPIRGFVARYARGPDYHHVLKQRLYALADAVRRQYALDIVARPCVDSAPVLERDVAEAAGVGFTAKNTMLIAPGLGSYFVLGELLLSADLATTSDKRPPPRCGSCRACIDACPTGAFVGPYVLDARRCISYLTIEHRGTIPRELRSRMDTMIFGCDICQEVCPFNKKAPDRHVPDAALSPYARALHRAYAGPERAAPDLLRLLSLGSNQRRRYIEGTALRRINRVQLFRNICIALGNGGDERALMPLGRLAQGDPSPIVRGHAAWALGQLTISHPHTANAAIDMLQRAQVGEADAEATGEINAALVLARQHLRP